MNDFELIQKCISGNKEAGNEFVSKYEKLIYWSIRKSAYYSNKNSDSKKGPDVREPFEKNGIQMSKSEMEDRANVVLKRVNLDDAHNKMPSEASGGMQKRVAIARAIVNNPKYLFCDEPNSGLDPKTAIVIDNLIQEITKEYNITTVINSHDMNSVMEIGETIIFLKDGLKAWSGSKETIFKTDNEVVTDFVYSSNLMTKVRQMYIEEKQ